MAPYPLRLLLAGYGSALALAVLGYAAGLSIITAAFGFWLAGPIVVAALVATPGLNRAFLRPASEWAGDIERRAWVAEEEELRQWDADLAAELADPAAVLPGPSESRG